jgi:hypothetical protein
MSELMKYGAAIPTTSHRKDDADQPVDLAMTLWLPPTGSLGE